MFDSLYKKYKASDVVGKYIFVNVIVYVFLLLIGIFSVLLNMGACRNCYCRSLSCRHRGRCLRHVRGLCLRICSCMPICGISCGIWLLSISSAGYSSAFTRCAILWAYIYWVAFRERSSLCLRITCSRISSRCCRIRTLWARRLRYLP